MILRLSYEELVALNSAAEQILGGEGAGVLAPPEPAAVLERRLPLEGDISVITLSEQRELMRAMETLVDHLHRRMDRSILDRHPAAEASVAAFFDYATVLTVRARLAEIGAEMEALIEVMSGAGGDHAEIRFPD